MRDRPNGAYLLRLARRFVLESLAPALPEAERYNARLVAKAMAIAAREMESGQAGPRARHRALEELFGEAPGTTEETAAAETLDEALTRLNWRLAAEIRGGGRDADSEVHALLVQDAEARLALVKARTAKPGEAATA